MSRQTHIKVRSSKWGPTVVVDDYELFDYLDDIFTDKGLRFVYLPEAIDGQGRVYSFLFPVVVDLNFLRMIVDGIDESEVERIWRLNN